MLADPASPEPKPGRPAQHYGGKLVCAGKLKTHILRRVTSDIKPTSSWEAHLAKAVAAQRRQRPRGGLCTLRASDNVLCAPLASHGASMLILLLSAATATATVKIP
eukprot:1140441-Pelagomonas_calceolata.AAC.2